MRPRLALAVLLPLGACGQFGLEPIDPTTNGRLAIAPATATDFGELMPETQGGMENFVLSPVGTEDPVEVEDAWIEGDTGAFTIAGAPSIPRRLDPGQKFGVRVRFSPPASGSFEGEFVAQTGTGDQVRRALSGTGCKDKDDNHRCD